MKAMLQPLFEKHVPLQYLSITLTSKVRPSTHPLILNYALETRIQVTAKQKPSTILRVSVTVDWIVRRIMQASVGRQ